MGTINYGTSDYITLGIKPYDTDDFRNDKDFMKFIENEWNVDLSDDTQVLDAIYDEINDLYDCDRMNAQVIIDKYTLNYFKVTIEPGYYEGLYIDISLENAAFNDYKEKLDAQKEVTRIKSMMIDLAGCGYNSVYPGWCTTYHDYKTTLRHIKEAIKEMRADVKGTPTWKNYKPFYQV